MIHQAEFSLCKRYRYRLDRSWLFGSGMVAWVLLNPSTADAQVDDPTIRRCIRFAQHWGYQRMSVVNLFAFRSTSPSKLLAESDPIGPDNDSFILKSAISADIVVVCWGNNGTLMNRDNDVMSLLFSAGITPSALDVTKSNSPKHPLYVKYDKKLFPYINGAG